MLKERLEKKKIHETIIAKIHKIQKFQSYNPLKNIRNCQNFKITINELPSMTYQLLRYRIC